MREETTETTNREYFKTSFVSSTSFEEELASILIDDIYNKHFGIVAMN